MTRTLLHRVAEPPGLEGAGASAESRTRLKQTIRKEMARPTIRSLARALGLSRSTVSEALRHSPRINAETARRVCDHAATVGYRANPLASSVMSEIRRSHNGVIRGALAAVLVDEPQRPKPGDAFISELVRGATERARDLGFHLDRFSAGAHSVPIPRLYNILRSRGITGIVLLPAWGDPDFSQLDWSEFSGVYTDSFIEHPALNAVSIDHHRSMMAALRRLRAMGYRRPGLFLHRHQDERLQHRWEGPFRAFQQYHASIEAVPPLVLDEITPTRFKDWFERFQPDVVLGHHAEAISWMTECGAQVPATHGFFCLNLAMTCEPCAGLDLRPHLLGTRAAEMLVDQLQRNEFGIPQTPSLTTMPAVWIDGATVRTRTEPEFDRHASHNSRP